METRSIVKMIRFFMILLSAFIALSFGLISCGGGGGGGASTGAVTTSITDPPTCQSPNGPFDEVWVTITRVRAHTSSDAGPGEGSWVDLVDLRSNPRQINLLDLASTECLLTELGSTSGIPAGKYQQIRLYLLSNSPSSGETVVPSANNRCGSNGYNCVVMGGDTEMLLLSSQANTGIKIPPGQIAGGGFTVVAGQTVDLNIDFDACSSIVQMGNGEYRLKPTLRAAEVSVNTRAISGRIIDNVTKLPVPNATVMLEVQKVNDPGIDRVYAQKLTGEDGRFIFCPLPEGYTLFDVVAVAPTYNTTITLQIPIGQMGDIPLMKEPGGTPAGTISGQVSTKSNSSPVPANVQFSALQSVPAGSLLVTIPLFTGSVSNVITDGTTQGGIDCQAGSDCADYTLNIPAGNPYVGSFSTSTTYTKSTDAVLYKVEARAFPSSADGATSFCSPSRFLTEPGVPPNSVNVNFAFTGCGEN